MKKIGILLAILLVAGVCAMADEAVTVQDDILFADIDAVVLSTVEMEAVDGDGGPFIPFIAGAIAGGLLYDSVASTSRRLSGKTPYEHYESTVDRMVNSVKKYITDYQPDFDAPGPKARARARG